MKNMYDVTSILYKIIPLLMAVQWDNEYYNATYSSNDYTLKNMLGNTSKSAQYKYILTTIDKLLKQRYGWQIIIKNCRDEFKDDRLVEASITDALSFKIHNKNNYIHIR